MNHTKEPWRTTELDRVIADTMEALNDDYFIADCFGPDAKENARRIVACVNACADIPTDWLEKTEHIFAEHDAQRDELLAAAKEYLPYMPQSTAKEGGAASFSAMLKASDKLKDQIAKCEAQS